MVDVEDESDVSYSKEYILNEALPYFQDNNQDAIWDLAHLKRYVKLSGELKNTGSYYYTGDVNTDGTPHGNGLAIYEDNCYYYGQWENGVRSGEGRWFHFYIGVKDQSNAMGKYMAHSYSGSWKNNLPDGSGYDFLAFVKESSKVPVILLTANDLEIDQVTGLSLGADDYITKPFSLAVLRARIEVQKRRIREQRENQSIKSILPNCYVIENLKFDFERLCFFKGEEELSLSRNEQRLLQIFLKNQGRILTREILMERLWQDGAEFVDENALSVTINRLRKKIEGETKYIQTVYGQGYIWRKEE